MIVLNRCDLYLKKHWNFKNTEYRFVAYKLTKNNLLQLKNINIINSKTLTCELDQFIKIENILCLRKHEKDKLFSKCTVILWTII